MTLRTGNASNRSPAGFTLLELIIVMTLLAIVITLTAPRLSAFFRGRNLDSEGRRLLSLARLAQSRAVSEGTAVLVWVDERRGHYGMESDPTFGDQDTKSVEYVVGDDLNLELSRGSGNASATLRKTSYGMFPAIRFLPDGAIDEDSPAGVQVSDLGGEALWLTQTGDGSTYEISPSSR